MSIIRDLDPFTRAYIECALWSSTDNDYHGEGDPRNLPAGESNGGEPLDANYSIKDMTPECVASMAADCARFQLENAEDIDAGTCKSVPCPADEYAGHDFWLTRNGHGCGFWDGDWPEPAASRLTKAAKAFRGCDLMIGDDGRIHCV